MRMFVFDRTYAPGQYLEDMRVVRKIGEGRFGICYLAADSEKYFLVKQLKRKRYLENPRKAQFEGDILKRLQFTAIPGFIRKIENGDLIAYVLEYKPGASLEQLIFKQKHVFNRGEIYRIGRQLIDILDYLHQNGVVHRDIRVPNVLLEGTSVYLVDFGLARWSDGEKYMPEIDFSYLGDLLLHLYYTSYQGEIQKNKPWYEELTLSERELAFLKRLMGLETRYKSAQEVRADFEEIFPIQRK